VEGFNRLSFDAVQNSSSPFQKKDLSNRFKLVVRLNEQVAPSTYYQFMKYPVV
jgi:hypothetical protein